MVSVRPGSVVKIHLKTLNLDEPMGHLKPTTDVYLVCTVVSLNALGCDVLLPDREYKTISLNSITEVVRY